MLPEASLQAAVRAYTSMHVSLDMVTQHMQMPPCLHCTCNTVRKVVLVTARHHCTALCISCALWHRCELLQCKATIIQHISGYLLNLLLGCPRQRHVLRPAHTRNAVDLLVKSHPHLPFVARYCSQCRYPSLMTSPHCAHRYAPAMLSSSPAGSDRSRQAGDQARP